jgi:hypothetical protein
MCGKDCLFSLLGNEIVAISQDTQKPNEGAHMEKAL